MGINQNSEKRIFLYLGSSVAIRVGSSPTTAPPKHTWMLFYENPDEPALVAESSD